MHVPFMHQSLKFFPFTLLYYTVEQGCNGGNLTQLPSHTPESYEYKMTNICDRICKKGSYTRTTSTHRFHHHSIDTLSDNPWVHVLRPTVHQSAFPEAVSGACQTSMNARFVSSCPCWLLNEGHRAVRSHTTL